MSEGVTFSDQAIAILRELMEAGQPKPDPAKERDGLRDYFAAAALTGICGHITGAKPIGCETKAQADVRFAYERADAMLAARATGGAA